MSIDGHEVVPQRVQSACVVIVACGVLIPDPRKASWRGSKVNTDQDETRAPSRLPDVRPRMSLQDWRGLQFGRCLSQFERGTAQKRQW